jgi:hypothetical protein
LPTHVGRPPDRRKQFSFAQSVASSTAVKDSCKLQAVSFPSRHLRDFTSTATRTSLSNFSQFDWQKPVGGRDTEASFARVH